MDSIKSKQIANDGYWIITGEKAIAQVTTLMREILKHPGNGKERCEVKS